MATALRYATPAGQGKTRNWQHSSGSTGPISATDWQPFTPPCWFPIRRHSDYDGSGYAQGLRAEQISVIGQMAAICDVYDAITSERVYHKAMAPTEALGKLFEWSESLFDAQLVRAFIGCVGIYPVGTLVLLESGRLALVIDQHEDDLLQPLVRIIFHSRANRYLPPEDLDLSRASTADRILRHEDPAKWGIDPARFL